jgi:hypothetical protein
MFVHAIAIFIPLNLLVSYSFFSIKVASSIWFLYGFYFKKDSSKASTDIVVRGQNNLIAVTASESRARA